MTIQSTRMVATNPGTSSSIEEQPLYHIWDGIKQRCYNPASPKYPRYGGRGISMDPAWRVNFWKFAESMGTRPSDKHSVDRIDNTAGYFPGNVRWATPGEQQHNRLDNIWMEWAGVSMLSTDWERILECPSSVLRVRYKKYGNFFPRHKLPKGIGSVAKISHTNLYSARTSTAEGRRKLGASTTWEGAHDILLDYYRQQESTP
jgi:hypothetical protein